MIPAPRAVLLAWLLACGCAGEVTHERIVDRHGRIVVLMERRDGCKHGEVRFLWPDGSPRMIGHYENDRRTGSWRSFDQRGRLRALLRFTDGIKDGTQLRWNEQGAMVRVERFTHGVPDGPLIKFYDDGGPEQWSTYVNGVMQGAHYHWWRKGNTSTSALTGWYEDGRNTGEWIEMTPDRKIMWHALFKNGRIVRTIVKRKEK